MEDRLVTVAEAARYLNVSPPFVGTLLDQGHLPGRQVGKDRRIPLADLTDYKARQDAATYDAMAELQAMAQEEE